MLDWQGREVEARLDRAIREGINATMAAAVISAKSNHLWRNRTGTLERSIQVAEYARDVGGGVISGRWGSLDVLYAWYLEFGTSRAAAYPFLRPAADHEYPKLHQRIQRAYGT